MIFEEAKFVHFLYNFKKSSNDAKEILNLDLLYNGCALCS